MEKLKLGSWLISCLLVLIHVLGLPQGALVFIPLTALQEEKRQLLAPQWVPVADLPWLLPAAHPNTGGCLRPGCAPGICRL